MRVEEGFNQVVAIGDIYLNCLINDTWQTPYEEPNPYTSDPVIPRVFQRYFEEFVFTISCHFAHMLMGFGD